MNELVSNDRIKVCTLMTYSELHIRMKPISRPRFNLFFAFLSVVHELHIHFIDHIKEVTWMIN